VNALRLLGVLHGSAEVLIWEKEAAHKLNQTLAQHGFGDYQVDWKEHE
jgi:hypothetical protein